MIALGLGIGRRRKLGTAVPLFPSPPNGFALNGSANVALKAMLARVRGGQGRGRIVFKGDSTTAGAGSGTSTVRYNSQAREQTVRRRCLLRG